MSPNRRIVLNIIATYGRSLYSLIISLLCGRWALMALGQIDYGLMGVVGGLTAFISFFNNVLALSVGRFYAFSVGSSQKEGNEDAGLIECRRWFTVAVSIHTIIPIFLMLIGYPIGIWAVENYLVIPPDRVNDCIWVFRFVCITCFLSMISVPMNAMYQAKQYIAELTIYSFITTTLNAFFLYYMVMHPGVWLAHYAFWTCLLSVVPSLIITFRAYKLFPECRIIKKYLFSVLDIKELLSFAGWNFFGSLGNLLKMQGVAIVVNKMLGPKYNASMNIANTVAGQTQTLSGALLSSFYPAIISARGAEDWNRMYSLVYKVCKLGTSLVLIIAIPLMLEVDEVMILWLKNPPAQSAFLCVWLMIVIILENMTTGLYIVISANGRIAWYQFLVGICFIATLPLAWFYIKCGLGIYSVGYALFTTLVMVAVIRVVAAKILLNVSPKYWIIKIFLPIVFASCVSAIVGYVPSLCMAPSFIRVCTTTLVTESVLIPLILFVVMDTSERMFLKSKFQMVLSKIKR